MFFLKTNNIPMPNGDHKEILDDKTGTCPVGSNILYMNFSKKNHTCIHHYYTKKNM